MNSQGPSSRIVIVEPHPDDAALGLGAWICSIAAHADVDVLLLFSESAWAPYLRAPVPVRDVRLSEEAGFLRQFGLHGRDFGFPDASLLGFDAVQERQAPVDTDPRLPKVAAALACAVAADAFLLLPLGLGNHIDHLVARESRPPQVAHCAYYEELPYASHLTVESKQAVARQVFGGPARCWRFDVSPRLEAKRAALRHYASQMTAADIDDVLRAAVAEDGMPVERVWAGLDDPVVDLLLREAGFVPELPPAVPR